jgi:hypothetical protein
LVYQGGIKLFEDHQIFEKPQNPEAKLWRYMDFTKFVSILENQALYFTRSDKFRDKFEGHIPNFNKNVAPNVYSELGPENIEALLSQTQLLTKHLRERTVISCWHLNEYESAAMWDLYLKSSDGIAIQTTYSRLVKSFNNTDKTIYIGKVNYIDFENEWMPEGNAFYPFIHKRKSFEHEREIRAMHNVFPSPNTPSPFDWGVNINIDVDILIEKVYISPDAPNWFSELVAQIIKRYELNKTVVHSNLYELPK